MGDKTQHTGDARVPSNLKVWRENMGYSIFDACSFLGVDEKDYAHWENSGDVVPRSILLACAALALGIKA